MSDGVPTEVTAMVTQDALLDGRVLLAQPVRGYRVAVDPVLLAAAVPARSGQLVLDLGAGTGAAALCLATRVEGVRVVGLERQAQIAALATSNIDANGLGESIEIIAGDLADPPSALIAGGFDHVMANPPHRTADHGHPPRDAARAVADVEGDTDLDAWVDCALTMVRRKGTVTFVHRADRLHDLIAACHGRAGDMVVFPLWPRAGTPARRILFRARKGVTGGLALSPGLVLHEGKSGGRDNTYTDAAIAILRKGEKLDMV